jgi:succinate dehydrogenase / fumarate reductase iron-sulfur subunit
MDVKLRVRRFNPDAELVEPFVQEFDVQVEDYNTVLDALIHVREYVDDSLAIRCSCRGAICGSCGIRINGQGTLACKTKIVSVAADGDVIDIEPMGNMPVIKDLVTDMTPFWDKLRKVEPWLQPPIPAPKEEYLASSESMTHLNGVMACIMCGACVSDCTALEIDTNFIGPAALAKAYRFLADPRDEADERRLAELNKAGGIWDCTRCMQCVEVCPKGVDPMERIMALRDKAMEAGFTGTYGAHHADAFADIIRDSGWLDESMLTVRTVGFFNVPKLFSYLPILWRAVIHNKMPRLIHEAIPGVDQVRRIFDRVEGRK